MKQLLLSLLAILMPMVASADAVEIDGIYYNLITKAKEAEVTRNPDKYTGSVTIPESITYDGTEYSVTSIGEYSFYNCKDMTSVTIPYSVTFIGDVAFSNCNGLTSLHISDIAAWCNIIFGGSGSSNPLYYAQHFYLNDEEITELIIPNSVTSIGYLAFAYCKSLTSVTIPNSVTSIGESAFVYCHLTSVTIPNSVTTIGEGAFYGCTGLTSVTIPNSVTSIGDLTFGHCTGLTSVTIGNSVTSIGEHAFDGCTGLTSVTIPNSVTSISRWAFDGCTGLTSVSIGTGINRINDRAFASCPELIDVYCYANSVPMTSSDAFEGSYINYTTLHVPSASINAYKSKLPWSSFKSIVAIDGDNPETPKCETPIISYKNGKLTFSSETEGVAYVSEITDADIKKHYDSEVTLTATYTISVYATKAGYGNSEAATATLCWIDQRPETEGITESLAHIPARPVLIATDRGWITVTGLDDNTSVHISTIDGHPVGEANSHHNTAAIATNLQQGSVVLVQIGDTKSIKVIMR